MCGRCPAKGHGYTLYFYLSTLEGATPPMRKRLANAFNWDQAHARIRALYPGQDVTIEHRVDGRSEHSRVFVAGQQLTCYQATG